MCATSIFSTVAPVLDLKPYVAYADARPDASGGWLLKPPTPKPPWVVVFTENALARLAWLRDKGVDLRPPIDAALALGPQPHAYRRIRKHRDGWRLALKDWRVDFLVEGQTIVVGGLESGYLPKDLAGDRSPAIHRAFVRAHPTAEMAKP